MTPLSPAGVSGSLRARTFHVIFDSDQGWARAFDVGLILAILVSVIAVMLDSVSGFAERHGTWLTWVEWHFTIIFTIEYALRIWCVRPSRAYALSFFGMIDLLAVIPTYLSLLLPGGQYLAVIRVLRVMRVFRVLKLARYVGEAGVLGAALRAARYKIAVFVVGVITVVIVVGSLMYLIEGGESGFTSIPRGVYWAIVTLTTVGYGDIAPDTPIGQTLAAFVMILGYGIIAVPTGIVTAELTHQAYRNPRGGRECPGCAQMEPDRAAAFCRWCGTSLS